MIGFAVGKFYSILQVYLPTTLAYSFFFINFAKLQNLCNIILNFAPQSLVGAMRP